MRHDADQLFRHQPLALDGERGDLAAVERLRRVGAVDQAEPPVEGGGLPAVRREARGELMRRARYLVKPAARRRDHLVHGSGLERGHGPDRAGGDPEATGR